jgi:hypothetical protein
MLPIINPGPLAIERGTIYIIRSGDQCWSTLDLIISHSTWGLHSRDTTIAKDMHTESDDKVIT